MSAQVSSEKLYAWWALLNRAASYIPMQSELGGVLERTIEEIREVYEDSIRHDAKER